MHPADTSLSVLLTTYHHGYRLQTIAHFRGASTDGFITTNTVTVTGSTSPLASRDNEQMLSMLHTINERVDGLSRPPEYTA